MTCVGNLLILGGLQSPMMEALKNHLACNSTSGSRWAVTLTCSVFPVICFMLADCANGAIW